MFYRFYDAVFASKDYTSEVRTILELAGVGERSVRVLEIGSGTGNHTQVCAGLGHEVVGVEIDERMMAVATEKRSRLPAEQASRIRYFLGRIEQCPERNFDLALAMFNVVNYLGTLSEVHSFFHGIAERLMPGTALIFDAWNGVAAVLDPPGTKVTLSETETHVIETRISAATDLMALRTSLTYAMEARSRLGGAVERCTHQLDQTLWPPKVLADAVAMAGLQLAGVHPQNDVGRAASASDWKILFHCRKEAGGG